MTSANHGVTRQIGMFATRLAELMADSEHSFRTLGAAVNADPGYLNKVANGSRPIPGVALVRQLDAALHADGELVRLAERPQLAAVPTRPEPLGEVDARRARATVTHLVGLDTLHGSEGLVPIATAAFRRAVDQLAVAGGTSDVRSATADLGAVAAWVAADAVQRDLSRAVALEALALADLAGDTRLHQFLLSHLSMVSEHAGRYPDALAYAERILADRPENPRVNAMVQIRRARALSGLGAHRDALDAWDNAHHQLSATPIGDDGLTYWIHEAEMAIHKAVILTRGGDRHAVEWAHHGVETLPEDQGRDQVLFRVMLLEDAVTAHAWREVPAIVEDLLRYAGAIRSARVPEVLLRVEQACAHERVPKSARDAGRAAYEAFLPVAA